MRLFAAVLPSDHVQIGMALNNLGSQYIATHQYQRALELFEQATELLRGDGDDAGDGIMDENRAEWLSHSVGSKGAALMRLGRVDEAQACLQVCVCVCVDPQVVCVNVDVISAGEGGVLRQCMPCSSLHLIHPHVHTGGSRARATLRPQAGPRQGPRHAEQRRCGA